ncbi:hypothetical protein BD779DRAFT_1787315 [Infundibulicybe gibba]|nr:hypothetical protein BD779DRAFT_1787315 [Infundibulicybe gibba]
MSQHSFESICAILRCTSAEFSSVYDSDNLSTNTLCNDALDVIVQNHEHLRAAEQRYRLDISLIAMLNHAPRECGKRYIAVALRIAGDKGGATVVDIARAWMDYLFFLVLGLSAVDTGSSCNYPTPTQSKSGQGPLREKVATREQHKCAITGTIDRTYIEKLRGQSLEAPPGFERSTDMAVAHIIPVALLVNFAKNPTEPIVVHTRNMLISWTGLDAKKLSGSPADMARKRSRIAHSTKKKKKKKKLSGLKTNSPENAILMTPEEHCSFGQLDIYFDKGAHSTAPNKYTVRIATNFLKLSNGRASAEVEFHMRDGVQPPDPEYLAIHAAFAKVMNTCGAAGAFTGGTEDLEDDAAL